MSAKGRPFCTCFNVLTDIIESEWKTLSTAHTGQYKKYNSINFTLSSFPLTQTISFVKKNTNLKTVSKAEMRSNGSEFSV